MSVILALWTWQNWRDRSQEIYSAERLVSALARSAETQVEGSFRAFEAFLLEAAVRIDPERWPEQDLQRWFAARLQGFPEITYLTVLSSTFQVVGNPLGRDGDTIPGQSLDLSDQEFVQRTVQRFPEQGMTIGAPIFSRLTGKMVIPIAVPIAGPNGTVAGIIMGGIGPEALEKYLRAVVIEENGGAALFGEGAVFLSRVPRHSEFVGRKFQANPLTQQILEAEPKGVRRLVSPADGFEKIVAYRKLDRFPLMVTVGLTMETVLAQWHQKILIEGLLLVCFSAALLSLAYLYDRRSAANVELANQTFAAKDLAESLLRERSSFFAAASHDLRQPVYALRLLMAAIRGELDELKECRGELVHLVGEADRSIGALSRFLDRFLDIARLDASGFKPSIGACVVQDILDALKHEFDRSAAVSNVRLEVVESSCVVESDPHLLHRALANLIDNAIKFSEGGTVLVGCRRRGDVVEIQVCDNGVGIPEDQRCEIFREFFQLGNCARQRDRGVGLGLAIVSRVISLLNHEIQVRSVPGRGTVFSVFAPRFKG